MSFALITTGEGQPSFRIPREQALLSGLFKETLEEDPEEEDSVLDITAYKLDTPEMTLSALVEKVVCYMGIVQKDTPPDIDRPLRSADPAKVMTPAQCEFLAPLSHAEKRQLLLLANHLDFPKLLDFAGAAIALTLKGKKKEEAAKDWGAQIPSADDAKARRELLASKKEDGSSEEESNKSDEEEEEGESSEDDV